MKKLLLLAFLILSVSAISQTNYSTRVKYNVRKSTVHKKVPVKVSTDIVNTYWYNTTDSIIYAWNGVSMFPKFKYYKYSTAFTSTIPLTGTTSGTYSNTIYPTYIRESSILNNIPPLNNFTYPNTWCINLASNKLYEKVRNIVTVTGSIYTYTPSPVPVNVYTYSDWSECDITGHRARTVLTKTPLSSGVGEPILSETCTYVPPIVVSHSTHFYYVSPSGSDLYSKTQANNSATPWLTLYKAVTSCKSVGDTIFIQSGTYNENSLCALSVGVSILGEGTSTIIKTSFTSSSGNDGFLYLNSTAGPVNGNQFISNLLLDGNALTSTIAVFVRFRNNVSINNVTIKDFHYAAIKFEGNNNSYPNPPSVAYSSGNSIHDCILTNSSTSQTYMGVYGADMVEINGQQDFLFYNNVSDNTARPTGYNGKSLGGNWNKALKIYNNTFTKTNSEGTEWLFFFETWHYQGGCEIYGNTFNGAAGLDISDVTRGSYDYGIKIYDNTFIVPSNTLYNSHLHTAITFEEHGNLQDIYVYNNYFKNCPNGIAVIGWVNETDSRVDINNVNIYSNVFENIGSTDENWGFPIRLVTTGTDARVYWDSIFIYNNTMTSYTTRQTFAGIYWAVGGTITNVKIDNNIIQGFATYPIYFPLGIAGSTIDNISVQKNLFYLNSYANSANYSTVTVTNKTENSIIGNPLFVSTTDFHLQSGSPAENAGTDGANIGKY